MAKESFSHKTIYGGPLCATVCMGMGTEHEHVKIIKSSVVHQTQSDTRVFHS